MSQARFDFDTPSPPEARTEPRGSRLPADPERLAQRLERHPDYRVLRRLQPRLDFGPAPAGAGEGSPHVRRVLVLDTETTGLSHAVDKIIELALLGVALDARTGLPFGPVQVFEGFEDPGMPIPEKAREVTGISDDMVRGQRLDDAAVAALVEGADLVVAHNAGFDRPFVEARFPALADKAWACSFMDIDWKAAGAGSAKLGALAADQGWFFDAHRAQVDCHALLQLLTRPVGGDPRNGWRQLIDAAAGTHFRLRALGAPFDSKDRLKARGYRWDADAKVWFCTLATEALLDAECEWLRAEVYGRSGVRLEVEALDSRVRYSARPGKRLAVML